MAKFFVVFWLCLSLAEFINGHGYMKDPIGRNAATHPFANSGSDCHNGVINWTHKGQFCGGRTTQEANGGLCSACGDNYASSYPRPHDYEGKFATSITPTRIYLEGQRIEVVVEITAAHHGSFKFKLCNVLESNYPGADVLTECFNEEADYYLLVDDFNDGVFGDIELAKTYTYNLHLPAGVTCPEGCSLQWWYETGNSQNVAVQEHFVNCADIRIVNCYQYLSGDYDMTSCGYGPTTEVQSCTAGGESNGGESNGGENDGDSEGSESDDGDSEGSESGDQDAGDDNCPNGDSGFPAGSCAACTNAQSQTCSNDCCSEGTRDVYISSITDIPDAWCEHHCRLSPSFCPAKWCYKTQTVLWGNVCSEKKSLKTILERFGENDKKIKQMKKKTNRTIKN